MSGNCATCRSVVNTINIYVDTNQWHLVWLVTKRYFALVEKSSGNILSVGSTVASSFLVRTLNGAIVGVHAMEKSEEHGKITTYSCNCHGDYSIKDHEGQHFEVPSAVRLSIN